MILTHQSLSDVIIWSGDLLQPNCLKFTRITLYKLVNSAVPNKFEVKKKNTCTLKTKLEFKDFIQK